MHTTEQQDNQTTTQLNNKTIPSTARVTRDEISGVTTARKELSGRQYLVLRVSLFFRYRLSEKSHCVAVWSSSC